GDRRQRGQGRRRHPRPARAGRRVRRNRLRGHGLGRSGAGAPLHGADGDASHAAGQFPMSLAGQMEASRQTTVLFADVTGSIKLGLRIGFHAGPVIQRNNDIYGDTVNVAYRLHEQAKRGQVLTSDDTASLLPQLLRNSTRLLYPVPVKGKAEDVALCELVWRQSPDITDLATTMSVLRIPLARLRLKYLGRDIARRRGSDSLLIGRDAGCDLVVADTKASRQHCTIERRQDRFLLRDH